MHVPVQRRFEANRFRCHRMGKFQTPGVQHLPLGGFYDGMKQGLLLGQAGESAASAVDAVPHDGMPHGAAMHANLMGSSGLQIDLQQGDPVKALLDPP
jgi:hypothetical protein